MDIGIQDGEIVALDRNRFQQACVEVMGLNGLWKTEEEETWRRKLIKKQQEELGIASVISLIRKQ